MVKPQYGLGDKMGNIKIVYILTGICCGVGMTLSIMDDNIDAAVWVGVAFMWVIVAAMHEYTVDQMKEHGR
jgi:hypothetical protein